MAKGNDPQPDVPIPVEARDLGRVYGRSLRFADEELSQFFEDVVRNVLFQDFPELTVEKFRMIRNVAVADLWFKISDRKLAEKHGCSPTKIQDLRKESSFQAICESLIGSFNHESTPKEMRDIILDARSQHRIAKRMERIALYEKPTMTVMRAVEAMAERAMPTKTKGEDSTRVLVLQTNDAALLGAAMKEALEAGENVRELRDVTPES
jgi:hypothetical protein